MTTIPNGTRRIENIRVAVINGQRKKVFDVTIKKDSAWILDGTYSAPARTPSEGLIDFYWDIHDAAIHDD